MRRTRIFSVLALLGLFFLPITAMAHPVISIAYTMKFRFDSAGLVGIEEAWEFDQRHSDQILKMFDSNHDGKIESTELPALKRGYFNHLKAYSYFTTVVVGGSTDSSDSVTEFSATYQDHRMFYHLFLPLSVKASSIEKEVDVTLWDPTYFTDLEPMGRNAVTVEKSHDIEARTYRANDHRHFYNLAPGVSLIKKPPFYLPMQVLKFKLK